MSIQIDRQITREYFSGGKAFFLENKNVDTVKFAHEGKKSYVHFDGEDVQTFSTKKALRRALSQESGCAWIEEKEGKKRYFIDESGWFNTSYRQVTKEECLRKLGSPSTMQKVLGLGLGILALAPGAAEFARHMPFGSKEAAMGLVALNSKSPVLGALGCSLISSEVDAQAVGMEFRIDTYPSQSSPKRSPVVTTLQDGGFVVAWRSANQDTYGAGIFGQKYDDSGGKYGDEFQVNDDTPHAQYAPSIASLTTGDFVITWESQGQDGDGWGIFARRFALNTTMIGLEFQVNNYTSADQRNPKIAPLLDGGSVITWYSDGQDGDGVGVYAQRLDKNCNKLGTEIQVNNYTISNQLGPSIAQLRNGGFIIVWMSDLQDGDTYGVFGQRFDVNGTKIGNEFQINTFTEGSQGNPDVQTLDDGGTIVAWSSSIQDGNLSGVYAQAYDTNGNPLREEFQVNTFTIGFQSAPSISILQNQNYVVVWQSDEQDGDNYGVFGQMYLENGTVIGNEFQVNTYNLSLQYEPSVAALYDGGFVVTWAGQGYGIYGQRYRAGGIPVPFTYQPLASTSSTLSSNARTQNSRTTSSLTTENSVLSSSSVSSTPSSSTSASQSIKGMTTSSNQVESSAMLTSIQASTTSPFSSSTSGGQSSGLRTISSLLSSTGPSTTENTLESSGTTPSLSSSSTSGIQTTSSTVSSSLSGFGIPPLIDIIYEESYSVTLNGQTIGTFIISGGSGMYSSSNPNTLNITIDPDIVLQDGDTVTLFSIPQGEELQWEGIRLTNEVCFSAQGEFVENEGSEENSYQVVFNLDGDNCSIYAGAPTLGSVGAALIASN